MLKIKLELDIDDTNLLLEGLGQLPYIRVYKLVQYVQEQGRAQITASQLGPNGADRSVDDE